VISSTLLVACQLKNLLKIAFGRTWPREVKDVSVSSVDTVTGLASRGYVNDGIHAFHPFAGAAKPFAAFPSGSTAALIAVVVPVMLLYPRTRWPLLIYSAVSLLSFVVTNTHFVGDIIAGLYVGTTCGLVAVAIAEAP
jgi:membrane-associated phospholipid phosphatase